MFTAAQIAGAEQCPHPKARARHTMLLRAKRREFACCLECYQALGEIIRNSHAGKLSAREVVTALLELGYDRRDAARFVLSLAADRFKVRLGFMSESDL